MKKIIILLAMTILLPLGLLAGSGDVNGDGKVNVADIVELVSYINGNPSNNFNFAEADANNDGAVNEADVDVIADVVLKYGSKHLFEVNPNEITLDDSEFWQNIEIVLKSKTKEVLEGISFEIVEKCKEWLSIQLVREIDEDNGVYSRTYIFDIAPNISSLEREGKIKFTNEIYSCSDSVIIKTIGYMCLEKEEYHIANQRIRQFYFDIKSNVIGEYRGDLSYEIISPNTDWIRVSGNTFEYDKNETGKRREALVEVKNEKFGFRDIIKIISHPAEIMNDSQGWYVLTCQPSGDILEIPIMGDVEGLLIDMFDESDSKLPNYMERLPDEVRDGVRYVRFKVDPNTDISERYHQLYFHLGDGISELMHFVQPGCQAPSFAEQMEALKILYKETDGNHWENNTDWLSDKPINKWFGVNNDLWDGTRVIGNYVLRLRLDNNNLLGRIPAEMSKLMPTCKPFEFLGSGYSWHFTLEDNYLYGEIPDAVKNQISWNDLGWEAVPQENYCPYSGQFRWDDFNLKTKDGAFSYLVEDKTSTVRDVLQQNKYTVVFNAGLICEDPGWWSGISNKRINLYLDYCNKGLGMVAVACGTEGYPWDYGIDYVNTRLSEGMPTGIQWIRNEYGRSAFGSVIPKRLGSTYLLDQEGNLIQIWCGSCGNDDWCLEPISNFLKEHIGEPEEHEPFIPNYYTSTDFSQDGGVMTLQTATTGKGIDLVFLGEAYIDTDMEPGGLYEQTMKEAMEQFFTEEPYKSMRDRFNVYAVKAVSPNAVHDSGTTLAIGGDIEKAFEYAKKAVGDRDDRLMVGVICKPGAISERSCTFMFEGDGSFAAWMFEGVTPVLNHEMGGHGVAFLLDEYVECGMEDLSPNDEAKAGLDAAYATYSEGANVDWRSDPAEVKWAHFISDLRYAAEGIGVYEGAWLYGHGAYRPTENSMMRYNDCGFNAPSREAIYKRVMTLSEGSSWTYDYETFVSFDTPAREAYSKARAKARQTDDKTLQKRIESRPPTIYKGTWRDAGKLRNTALAAPF